MDVASDPIHPDTEPVSGDAFFGADPELIRHLNHPIRMRVYREAVRAAVSAKELADRFGEPLARVSYHVRSLADAGLLRPVRRTRRRGAIETHYRAVAFFEFDDETLRSLPAEVRRSLIEMPMRELLQDMMKEVEEGAGDEPDLFLARAHFVASAAGRKRLQEEVRAIYDRLGRLYDELDADAAAAAASGEETYELNVILIEYRGERHHDRNSPWVVNWEIEGVPTPLPIPPK